MGQNGPSSAPWWAPQAQDIKAQLDSGALAFDVKEVQPDFVAVAAYKWLLAPYSTGFLYAAPQHRSGTPLEQNWITREGSSNFARLIAEGNGGPQMGENGPY